MGKKQHQKDKMYLTCTEWSTLYGGKRPKGHDSLGAVDKEFRRLPFDHCALSLQPFENPYSDHQGNVFELIHLIPFLKKFKLNPITGEKMEAKNLIKTNFHKNADGKYHCPVLYKEFNANSHMVLVKTTGNIFSYEAIEELNIKAKNWKELLTDEPFTRNDLITIQDPRNLKKFNLSDFHHLKNNLKIVDEELLRAQTDPNARLKNTTAETKDILEELNREYKPAKQEEVVVKSADSVNAAHYSTGAVAASFTSTSMPVFTVHEAAVRDEDSVRYERLTKKGYVRLVTNLGQMNFELHCPSTPKACENFILLCKRGYYDGTKFHRSIKHFMIQGGDPAGTGTGGESAWEQPFEDEIQPNLHHEGRGVLSMANSGPNSNKSQFFITFRSCKHLDGKHTVFGKLVGGTETLSAMEKIETDNKDRPIEDIVLLQTQIFTDPYTEVDAILAEERAKAVEKQNEEYRLEQEKRKRKAENKPMKVYKQGVGKYINPKRKFEDEPIPEAVSSFSKVKKAPAQDNYGYKNFQGW